MILMELKKMKSTNKLINSCKNSKIIPITINNKTFNNQNPNQTLTHPIITIKISPQIKIIPLSKINSFKTFNMIKSTHLVNPIKISTRKQ